MKPLTQSPFGMACVLILVACGFAHTFCGDFESELFPFLNGEGCGTQQPSISVNEISWSADSRLLLSCSRGEAGSDGSLPLYDRVLLHDRAGSWRAIDFDADPEERLASAVLSSDGLHILVGTYQGRVLWIDRESSQIQVLFKSPETLAMKLVALSPDGRTAVAAFYSGSVCVFDVNLQSAPRILSGPPSTVSGLSFSSDGRRLLTAANNGLASIWDLVEGQLEWEFTVDYGGRATAAAFLTDGQKVITAGPDGTVRIWTVGNPREEWTGQFERGATNTLALSPDGKTAAWAGYCRKILVWDLERRREKFEIATPSFFVQQLRFSPDGNILAAAGMEEMIRLYDARTGIELPGIDVSARL